MISAIVLAAGCSSRMGTQKLLLPFGQKTIISHIVIQVLSAGIEDVHVVVGHQAKEVMKELSGKSVSVVHNPEYQSGMLSSVRVGLQNISQTSLAVFVFLGDQPSVKTEIIKQMIQALSSTKKKIIVPIHKGKRGHPILFSTILRKEILTHYDEVGLRGILQTHEDDVFEMNVSDSAVLSDMDYPEDYHREIAKYKNSKEV